MTAYPAPPARPRYTPVPSVTVSTLVARPPSIITLALLANVIKLPLPEIAALDTITYASPETILTKGSATIVSFEAIKERLAFKLTTPPDPPTYKVVAT